MLQLKGVHVNVYIQTVSPKVCYQMTNFVQISLKQKEAIYTLISSLLSCLKSGACKHGNKEIAGSISVSASWHCAQLYLLGKFHHYTLLVDMIIECLLLYRYQQTAISQWDVDLLITL